MANSNYLTNAAFAVAQPFSKGKFHHLLAKSDPVLALIISGGRFNKRGNVNSDGRFVVPIIYEDTGVTYAGVARADQLTAMSRALMVGQNQAEYEIAHYRGLYTFTAEEKEFLSGGAGAYYGNVLQVKRQQVENKVTTTMATTTMGSQNGSRTAHMGILRALSAGNTVGNINQATASWWQSNVNATGGPITLDAIDRMIDDCEIRGEVDLIVASKGNTGPNIHQAILGLIRGQEILMNNGGALAKYGFKAAEYAGVPVVGSRYFPTAATGSVVTLSTKNWYAVGSVQPNFMAPNPIDGTDAHEVVFHHFFGLGTDDPGANGILSGLTG